MQKNPKFFVLDPGVFRCDPDAWKKFGDNVVVLPISTIGELDKLSKKNNGELGRNARSVIKSLEELRKKGNLHKGYGVELETRGSVRVYGENDLIDLPLGLIATDNGNNVLQAAYSFYQKGLEMKPRRFVKFISLDKIVRVKADCIGIHVGEYDSQKVEVDKFLGGVKIQKVKPSFIDNLCLRKKTVKNGYALLPNKFIRFENFSDPSNQILAREKLGEIIFVEQMFNKGLGIAPRNLGQTMALELLMDPDILLVLLIGEAGTGKTLLALFAGLSQSLEINDYYEKTLITRPIMPMGKDIGYLPGTKDEKLSFWMQPIFDNLGIIIRANKNKFENSLDKGASDEKNVQVAINRLVKNGQIRMEALTYIRGRSIPGQFVVVDEAQNLTPHEVKTIISRAGKNTKMVFCGDPTQIDNPDLDEDSNGVAYLAERLEEQSVCGHVILTEHERSPLSLFASTYL